MLNSAGTRWKLMVKFLKKSLFLVARELQGSDPQHGGQHLEGCPILLGLWTHDVPQQSWHIIKSIVSCISLQYLLL